MYYIVKVLHKPSKIGWGAELHYPKANLEINLN